MSTDWITLGRPRLGSDEQAAVAGVLRSEWLTMGEQVAAFEQGFAQVHGQTEAVAVNSCTAALHLAYEALGIGPGDEVVVPSLSFAATANGVLYCGATPVFADIGSLAAPWLGMEAVARCLTSRTKAVTVMHYAGFVADMERWRAFADEHGLLLLEDAAHSPAVPGVGTFSDASCFSFFSNKNMTTGEGGMILSPRPEILHRARLKRSHGMTKSTLERDRGHAYSYDIVELGYNYRLDELRAAIGLVQLRDIDSFNRRRAALDALYRAEITRRLPDLGLVFDRETPSSYHIMPVLLPEAAVRHAVMDTMREARVQTSIHYPPIHLFSYYVEKFGRTSLPNTELFASRELTLPLHPLMSDEDVGRVVGALAKALGR